MLDFDGRIKPLTRLSSSYLLTTRSSIGESGLFRENGSLLPGTNSILWSYERCSGNVSASCGKNASNRSRYSRGSRALISLAVSDGLLDLSKNLRASSSVIRRIVGLSY